MIERPRKRGPFDPRWMRMGVRRHLHVVASSTPVVPEEAALDSWEAEGGAPYTRDDDLGLRLVGSNRRKARRSLPVRLSDPGDEGVVSIVARLPLTAAIEMMPPDPRGHV